jgi:hypothetical protein
MRLIITLLALVGFQLKAQNDTSHQVVIESYIDVSSSSIRSDFLNTFYKGEFITNELKNNTRANLSNNNRFGADISLKSTWFGKDTIYNNWKPNIAISYRQFAASSFSEDLFNTVFYGNSLFANNKATFDGLNMNYMAYQSIDFGLYRLIKNKKIGFSLGIVKGSQFINLDSPQASLFTSTNASQLDFVVSGSMKTSDTSKTNLSAWNGTGLKANLFYEKTLKTGDQFGASLSDLGFIAFNQQSLSYTLDSTYTFSGVEINNLLSPSDSMLNLTTDVDSLIPSAASGSQMMLTPTKLRLYYVKRVSKSEIHFSLDQVLNTSYFPHVQVDYLYKVNELIIPSFHIGYGGFTNEHFGLGINFSQSKFDINLQARAIQGWIGPSGLNHTFFGQLKWNI